MNILPARRSGLHRSIAYALPACAALLLAAAILPTIAPAAATEITTHKLIITKDGKTESLGNVTFNLKDALCKAGTCMSAKDLARFARSYFGVNKAQLTLTLDANGGKKTPDNLYFSKKPKATVKVVFGSLKLSAAKLTAAASGKIASLSLGTVSQCDLLQGNPIHIGTGNKLQRESQFAYRSPGRPFSFILTYNSQLDESRPTGYGWMHSFEMYGNFNYAAGWAGVRRSDGKWLEFTADENGIWQNIDHSNQRLEWQEKQVTLVDGDTHYIFGATGQLARIENARGYGQTLAYAPGVKGKPGLLKQVTDDFGATITFAYDAKSRLSKVTDPAGRIRRYGHDARGNLTSVTRPDGSIRRYVYENKRFPHHLTGIVDGEGRRYATYRYDAKGRGIESFHGAGREKTDDTVIHYADSNKRIVNGQTFTLGFINYQWTITEVAHGKNASDKQPWKGPGTCSGIIKRTYYPDGKLATVTDELGKLTTYTLYDRWGRPRGITENPGTDHQRSTLISYHPALDRITRIVAAAPNGEKTTDLSYDDYGDLLEMSENGFTPEHRPVFRDVHYAWNDTGRMVMVDGPREDVKDITRLAYYANTPEMGTRRGRLKSITDAAGRTATVTAYDAFGRVLERTLANGTKVQMKYDAMGRVISRTLSDAGDKRIVSYAYDKSGLLTTLTNPAGRTVTYRYTSAEKPAEVTDSTGRTLRFTYDARGRMTGRTILDHGKVIASNHTAYDVRNHPVETVNALSEPTRYHYDMAGRLTETDDAEGRVTKLAYDAFNRIKIITDPADHTTAFAYDIADNLSKVTAPNGVPTAYTYDDLGNRWKEDSKDRGVLDYRYDAAGLLTTQTNALKQQGITSYDALGRPVSIQYGKSDKIRFSYGKKGGGTGKLVEIRENSGSLRYGYTAFGELADVQQTFKDGPKFTQSYIYDNAGRISTATLPGGQKITYNYDDTGRLAGLSLDGQPILTHMRYHTLDGITSATWGNGLKYQASYDALGRVVSQTQGKRTVAYAYDKAGNIVKKDNQTYSYDKLDRLVGATKVKLPGNLSRGDIRYQYDANGNRVSVSFGKEKTDYAYQPGTNRLSKIGDVSLKYDAAGNLIEDGRFTYTYNARGRLANVADKKGNLIATYTYNALGLRTSKTFKDRTTYYVYNPNGMLAAEADKKGRILRQYVWLGIRPLALIEGDQTYYIHTDHLGTPKVVTNASKETVWQWQPTPFGMGKPMGSITLNLRFPGQYFDAETGLNYNWNRYYDPITSRYINSDPIGLLGGMNLFGYADGNPALQHDVEGLKVYLEHHKVLNNEFLQDTIGFPIYSSGAKKLPFAHHLAILMIPDDQASFANVPGFRLGDKNSGIAAGKWYRVLSSGPSFMNPINGGVFGNLTAEAFRGTDLPGKKGEQLGLQVHSGTGNGDTALILRLNCMEAYYERTANINYDVVPQPGTNGYNSNSFAVGLLNAVGARYTLPANFLPGASKPVPLQYFLR